jgi:hypothetical protein
VLVQRLWLRLSALGTKQRFSKSKILYLLTIRLHKVTPLSLFIDRSSQRKNVNPTLQKASLRKCLGDAEHL